jgi:hypothetical protein
VYTSKALRISLKEQLLIEDKLRKLVKQQLDEKTQEDHVLREATKRKKRRLKTKLRKSKKNWEHIGCKLILN